MESHLFEDHFTRRAELHVKIRCHISIANANSFVSRSLACPTKDFCLTSKHEMTAVVLLIKWRQFLEAQKIKLKSRNFYSFENWTIWISRTFSCYFYQSKSAGNYNLTDKKGRENQITQLLIGSFTISYNFCTLATDLLSSTNWNKSVCRTSDRSLLTSWLSPIQSLQFSKEIPPEVHWHFELFKESSVE